MIGWNKGGMLRLMVVVMILMLVMYFWWCSRTFLLVLFSLSFGEEAPGPRMGWCGDWTPRGNLGNVDFSATYLEEIAPGAIPGCVDTAVGQPYEPDPASLYCNPPLRGGNRSSLFHRDPAMLALDLKVLPQVVPEYSIIMPSHNVAEVLHMTVPLVCEHTVGTWEIVFVLDQSYDDSLQVLREILLSDQCLKCKAGTMVRARVLVQPTSIFETSSDNLGLSLAGVPSHFYVEVQSDMIIASTGWNRDLARPILQYGDIFAVSGRCGHHSTADSESYFLGRCGADIGELNDRLRAQDRNVVHVTATINRGPILFRADAMRKLKFFDEVNFIQGNDDHDLFRRALHHGWHVGYKYSHMYAPLNLSPGRNKTFAAKTPEDAAQQSKAHIVYRNQLKNTSCDAAIPFGVFAKSRIPKCREDRNLEPLPEDVDLQTLLLSPLPPLVYGDIPIGTSVYSTSLLI